MGSNPIWYLYEKRKFGHRYAQRDHMKTQRENSCLQAKHRGLRRNQPYQNFYLGLPDSGTVGNKYLLFKLLSQWYFVMAAYKLIPPPLWFLPERGRILHPWI